MMKKTFSLLSSLLFLSGVFSSVAVYADIEMFLETPSSFQTIIGVLFIRGWATAPEGIDRVEVTINGESPIDGRPFVIPMGEPRPDVNNLYPDNIGSANAGFNIGFFFSSGKYFTDKKNTMKITAFDKLGAEKSITRDFNTKRFETSAPNNFIRDLNMIDMTQASVGTGDSFISLRGVIVDHKKYNITINFNTTLQSLAITNITPVSSQ